jgi:uncharacterized protein YqgV (UPF0045/DUF77 family)
MTPILNAGLQIIPLHVVDPTYTIVNNVIGLISATNLPYLVTPYNNSSKWQLSTNTTISYLYYKLYAAN